MDFDDAANLAKSLIAEHKLRRWVFVFNRGKRTLGLCDYSRRRIELSMYFVAHNDEVAVRDTVLHEVAHALAGEKAGHGPKWRAVCRRIGAAPKRLDHEAVMPRGHWVATCPTCGESHTRFRRPPLGRHYFCRSCGSDKGKLRFGIPTYSQVK